MKSLFYSLLKPLIRFAFHCYYQKIEMDGLDKVPRDRPVMLLPNHQNALLDPLLVAAFARARKPYFLTRSDVFQGRFLKAVFEALRMIPIYRLRDGRDTLHKNEAIFDRCSELLSKGEHLLLFPEANHNLKRRVRPLSKGFTRIVIHTLQQYPQTPLQLLPVGINYQDGAGFPDRVAFRFGPTLPAKNLITASDLSASSRDMKAAVTHELKKRTTHIPDDTDYQEVIDKLNAQNPDYLKPKAINAHLENPENPLPTRPVHNAVPWRIWDLVFRLFNFPVILLWRWVARNKVWEPEFMSTFRFCFALLVFPVYLGLLGGLLLGVAGTWYAIGIPLALFLHNLLYVKVR